MGGISATTESTGSRFFYALARSPMKEACAEFLATFVLVVLGDGVMAGCVLGKLNFNAVLVGAFGWGFAVMVAVAMSAGVSGGHVNPAVTVGLVSVRKCQSKRIVPYLIAQYIASFLAAAVVYSAYADAIAAYDDGFRQIPPSENATAQIFATYSANFASPLTCFVDQVIGTALFLILICAATDVKNLRVPPHTQPILIGLGISAIVLAFGHNCGAPLNPARDLAPRIFTAISGWGIGVFSYRNYEWFWIPVIAPHVGGIVGAWLYKGFIELPFEYYSRLLQETESPNYDEERKCLVDVEVPSPSLKETSSEGSVCKSILENVADHEPAVSTYSSVAIEKQEGPDAV